MGGRERRGVVRKRGREEGKRVQLSSNLNSNLPPSWLPPAANQPYNITPFNRGLL